MDYLNITDVRIFLTSRTGPTKAFASVTFDDVFVVKDLRVVDGKKGLFVSMPSRKDRNGEFRDVCHPITTEMRNIIQEAVIEKFNQEIA
ncbi:MAG TPA: septation regulator SpoVG [Halanaerobiales bacterium]|nr:septation regulator SpoVG [Halanaerobiales bacterium]